MTKAAIYIRVSTDEQDEESQISNFSFMLKLKSFSYIIKNLYLKAFYRAFHSLQKYCSFVKISSVKGVEND